MHLFHYRRYPGTLVDRKCYDGFFSYDPHHNTVKSFNLNQPDENAVSSFIFRNQDVYTMYYDNDLVQYNTISKTLRIKLLAELWKTISVCNKCVVKKHLAIPS